MAEENRNFVDQVYVTDGVSSDNGQIIDIGAKANNIYFNDNVSLPTKLEEYQKKILAGQGISINDNTISINSTLKDQINQKQDINQKVNAIGGVGDLQTYPSTRAVVRYAINFLRLTKSVTSTYNYIIDNTSPRLIYVVLNQNQDNFPKGEYFVLSFGAVYRIWISGSNGDIYTQNSNDQGETWEQPVLKPFGTTINEDELITKVINKLPKYEGDIVSFEELLEDVANDSY